MVGPGGPVLAVGHVDGPGGIRDRLSVLGVRGLVGVVDEVAAFPGEELNVGLLHLGKLVVRARAVGEHGGAGAVVALGSRVHAHRGILVLVDGLKLSSGLEALDASSAHGQVGVAVLASVCVLLDVDVVLGVDHGIFATRLLPVLEAPVLAPFLTPVKEVAGDGGVSVALVGLDVVWGASILSEGSEVEPDMLLIVVGTSTIGKVTIALRVVYRSRCKGGRRRSQKASKKGRSMHGEGGDEEK